jgi:hypothetical protein
LLCDTSISTFDSTTPPHRDGNGPQQPAGPKFLPLSLKNLKVGAAPIFHRFNGVVLKFKIGNNLMSDPMELVTVPYSFYAEQALTVPDDSIEGKKIKEGTLELKHFKDPIQFTSIRSCPLDWSIRNFS